MKIKEVLAGVKLSRNYDSYQINLTADLDENGQILLTTDVRGREVPVWSKLKLVITSDDGGFYPITFKEKISIDRVDRVFRRDMVEAPEEGYKKELRISLENDSIFFYFKVRGLYGKGYLDRVRYNAGDKIIRANVTCYLNEDRTRNVEGP